MFYQIIEDIIQQNTIVDYTSEQWGIDQAFTREDMIRINQRLKKEQPEVFR